jgi:predicted MPP superfamily phosphohydrolase
MVYCRKYNIKGIFMRNYLSELKITEYKISARVKEKICFAFVSDLHHCENQPVLRSIQKISPDAVLVGGDFMHNMSFYTRGFEFLKMCSKNYPVFCSLGNHEGRYEGDIHKAIAETGAILLDNTYTCFKSLLIGGLTSGFLTDGIPELSWLDGFSSQTEYKILLSHHPEYYKKYIRPLSVDLVLSGHAHGGQWRLFGRGVYAPGQGIFPKYSGGVYENRLIVGRGIGNAHRIPRINNTPEVIKLVLNPMGDK